MQIEHTPEIGPRENLNTKSLEEQTKHGELASVLLIERLNNPVIRKQLLDTLEAEEQAKKGEINTCVILDEKGKGKRLANGRFVTEERAYVPKTREEIEKEFDTYLEEITSKTNITFDPHTEPHPNTMSPNWVFPMTGEVLSVAQVAVVESHEKGHMVRPYSGKFLDKLFSEAFDSNAVEFTWEDYYLLYTKEERGKTGFEEARTNFYHYLFNANEIAERMSQLKNYFGMRGDEEFTKEHLDYARAHYVQDTGLDNWMTYFFKAITPEKEEVFLKLINSAGI